MAARSNIEGLDRDHLQSVLTQALECAERLLDILGREQNCLRERDLEALTSTAAEKARLVARMEQLDRQRQMMTPRPHDSTGADSEVLPDTHDSPAISDLWGRLRDLLHRCQIQNRINGHAIQGVAKHVDRTVQILQGVSERSSVYGAHGKALTLTASRYMTRA